MLNILLVRESTTATHINLLFIERFFDLYGTTVRCVFLLIKIRYTSGVGFGTFIFLD